VKALPRWLWSHRRLSAALVVLAGFALLNVIAYRHAYALTHFASGGNRPPRPESLSLLQKVHVLLAGVQLPRPVNKNSPLDQGLTYEVHRITGGDVGLEAWHVPRQEARGLVVLFHGYSACKATELSEAKAFHDLGYATLLVDFRGSGGSGGDVTTLGVREADDVARTWEYARSAWPGLPVVLYGQSMGSTAILRAVAVHGVRPAAVVLECPFDRLVSAVANRFRAVGLPGFPGAQLLVFWGGVQLGFDGFGHNPVEYARAVDVPVLLLHGDADPRVRTSEVEAVYANLAGAKRLLLFPGTGHEPCLPRHPDDWKEAVGQFLGQAVQPRR
jgi:alpha-beta hydrolase superfamily lysophospholipase